MPSETFGTQLTARISDNVTQFTYCIRNQTLMLKIQLWIICLSINFNKYKAASSKVQNLWTASQQINFKSSIIHQPIDWHAYWLACHQSSIGLYTGLLTGNLKTLLWLLHNNIHNRITNSNWMHGATLNKWKISICCK